eukprot:222327-Amphidinium_carterae.1
MPAAQAEPQALAPTAEEPSAALEVSLPTPSNRYKTRNERDLLDSDFELRVAHSCECGLRKGTQHSPCCSLVNVPLQHSAIACFSTRNEKADCVLQHATCWARLACYESAHAVMRTSYSVLHRHCPGIKMAHPNKGPFMDLGDLETSVGWKNAMKIH